VEYRLLVLPACEENKELELVTTIADGIEDFKINRCETVYYPLYPLTAFVPIILAVYSNGFAYSISVN
jgi:hypothetical protein